MKIGLDVDGTITNHPPLFADLTRKWIKNGDEVWIITAGGDIDSRTQQMYELGISYTSINVVAHGGAPEEVGAIKGRFCKDNGIDLMIDDLAWVVYSCLLEEVPALLYRPPS